MGLSLGRLGLVVLFTWLALLLYLSTSLSSRNNPNNSQDPVQEAIVRIKAAGADIEELRRQNEELRSLLEKRLGATSPEHAPPPLVERRGLAGSVGSSEVGGLAHGSREHEELRREAEKGLWELWYMTQGELRKTADKAADSAVKNRLNALAKDLTGQWESLLSRVQLLGRVDGAREWRNARLRNLTASVQRRLHSLQNPPDCSTARKLQCQLNKGCGFGCQIHHAAYCAIVAFATERTLVLETTAWRYSQRGWTSVFQPVGPCDGVDLSSAVQWKGPSSHDTDLVVSLPIVDSLRPSPEYLPLSFPKELSDELVHLHGNPPVWWIGQFVSYLMRYSKDMDDELKIKTAALGFSNPIVGLHVRRTDKLGSEAQFHSLAEYMEWAARWYRLRELRGEKLNPGQKRRVFLATDDKNLLGEAKKEYLDWDIMGSADAAASAQLSSRYSDSSLHGVLQDIHFLSLSDHLVCTFSSQVCRVAYELMQVRRGDWASAYDSLDDLFYFGGQHAHEVTAVEEHSPGPNAPSSGPQRQISMRVGDVIGIAGNHWDGWSKGRNTRTGELGLFPSYKVREKWRIVPFASPFTSQGK